MPMGRVLSVALYSLLAIVIAALLSRQSCLRTSLTHMSRSESSSVLSIVQVVCLSIVASTVLMPVAHSQIVSGATVDYFGNPVSYSTSSGLQWTAEQQEYIETQLSEVLSTVDTVQSIEIKPGIGVANVLAVPDRDGKPLILFNPQFVESVLSGTEDDKWVLMNILAHEVGHHVEFHIQQQLVKGELSTAEMRNFELAADEFAGEILYELGATLEQAQIAVAKFIDEDPSDTHPGRNARLFKIGGGMPKSRLVQKLKQIQNLKCRLLDE